MPTYLHTAIEQIKEKYINDELIQRRAANY